MRKEIIYCDKCKKEIHDTSFWVAVDNGGMFPDRDICDDCMNAFLKPDGPEVAPDPGPKPKKPRKIDRGKVWALRDADWKVSAIAGEIGCSDATIYNILNEGRPS